MEVDPDGCCGRGTRAPAAPFVPSVRAWAGACVDPGAVADTPTATPAVPVRSLINTSVTILRSRSVFFNKLTMRGKLAMTSSLVRPPMMGIKNLAFKSCCVTAAWTDSTSPAEGFAN